MHDCTQRWNSFEFPLSKNIVNSRPLIFLPFASIKDQRSTLTTLDAKCNCLDHSFLNRMCKIKEIIEIKGDWKIFVFHKYYTPIPVTTLTVFFTAMKSFITVYCMSFQVMRVKMSLTKNSILSSSRYNLCKIFFRLLLNTISCFLTLRYFFVNASPFPTVSPLNFYKLLYSFSC